ncbi:MAG: UvrD-helicase domain-containing protein [Nevskiaceae bacterium]
MDVTPLIGTLNPAQKEAVTAPPEHRLVLAGAGSGKTRVLVHRLAWLVAVENVSPHSVLAVTFTNKAAAEMRGRLERLINVPIRALWVGTFHGIAHRLLRLHWKEAKLLQNFQIMDSDDQQRFIKRVMKQLEIPEEQWPVRTVAAFINGQKEEGRRPQHLGDSGDFAQRQFVRIYTAYQAAADQAGLVDFAELLLRAYELCRDVPEIQAHYRRRFRHILVDEFQDTNTLQYAWLRVLAGEAGIIFCVGDDDQCVVKGTKIRMADGTEKLVEKVQVGDDVLSCYGSGDFRAATVSRVFRNKRKGSVVTLHTASGRRVTSTPEHTHFAGYKLGASPQTYFTYLMHKAGVGYRLGVSQVYTRGQVKPMVGFKQRLMQEHADAVWVVGTHASANEARIDEVLLSLSYGIPTLPFVARKGRARNGYVHDQKMLARVFAALDTEEAGDRLLRDRFLDPQEPHHRPRSRNSSRNNIVVTLCSDPRGLTSIHRMTIVGNSSSVKRRLRSAGFKVHREKHDSRSWSVDTCRANFDELLKVAHEARRAIDGSLVLSANLNGSSLPFLRAGSVRPGMAIVLGDGTTDSVARVKRREADTEVYDLNVKGTHNYVANGIVTHNSIYSWRGAKVENMMRLEKDFPGTQVVRLEQNYRSTGTILKGANKLIAHNAGRLGKNLWTDAGEGDKIQLYAAFSDQDEVEFVINRIRESHGRGGDFADSAILYRTAAQSRVFEEGLIRERIPYRIYGGLRFFERMEVKDALAYLRLTANRADDGAFERVVNLPPRGIGNTTMDRLRQLAKDQNASLWQVARGSASVLGRTGAALGEFLKLIDSIDEATKNVPLSFATEVVIDRSGLREHYKKERGEQAEARLENLDELVNAAKGFEHPEEEGVAPLDAFLTHAALEAGERQAGAGEDCVQLMTLHSAKGLEFPNVFLVGLEQGLFPHMRAVEEGSIEEERRLCYVGMTRAQQRLFLSHAEIRRTHGTEQIASPSQFLREIPAECIVETRPRAAILRPAWTPQPRRYSAPRPIVNDDSVAGLKLGQRVQHKSFGEGMITAFDGDGDRVRVEVRFRDVGTKWLMLSYANLQPL